MSAFARACLAGLLLCVTLSVPVAAADRVALVIGNAAYDKATPLRATRNDAEAVAASFERLGFHVIRLLDAGQSDTLTGLDEFANAMRDAEAAVFYYSGHGIQVNGENYLLPVDADVESERSLRYGAINVADVVHDMERAVPVSLVILDACRDNPFTETLQRALPASRSASVTRGLALIRPQSSGTIIAYAAAAGRTASDGSGDHSPYTEALLQEIETPDVEVGLLFRRVAGKVVDLTGGDQRPELLVRLTNEFYLNRSDAAATAAQAAAPAPAAPAPEIQVSADEDEGTDIFRGWEDEGLLPITEPLFEPEPVWPVPPGSAREEIEPNDGFSTAQSIEVSDRITAHIFPRRDSDWYRFRVGQGGVLQIVAENPPATLDLAVRLHDAEKRAMGNWAGTTRNGGVLDASFDLARPGDYWLEVADGRHDAESDEAFELVLSYVAQADAYEPNDSFGDARTVPLDGEIVANILPLKDTDWFRFQTLTPGELTVTAAQVADNLEVNLRLHNADGAVVGNWVGPARPGGDTVAVFELPTPGDYRLEVADSRNDQRAVEPFLMTTSFSASNDRFEPNDSFGRAARLELDTIQRFTIFPQRDVDWLTVEVDHPGELQFSITQVPADIDVNVRVHDEDKKAILNWVAPPRMGGDTVGQADLPRPGRYYLEIADGRNDGRSMEPIRLETHFVPTADQYEPNDSFGLATPISAGGELAFNIFPQRDTDWFRLRVEEQGELRIVVDEGPEDLDINVRVWNADKRSISSWFAPATMGGMTEGVVDLIEPGVYFLEIADGRHDGRSIQHATLKTVFTAATGNGEPNDTFGTANEVPLEGETQAHILPLRDADWHRFFVAEPGDLRVYVSEVDPALDVHLRLYDGERRTKSGWIGPTGGNGGDTDAAFAIEEPGWYWLEIVDGRNDARSAAPFTLTRTFHPLPE